MDTIINSINETADATDNTIETNAFQKAAFAWAVDAKSALWLHHEIANSMRDMLTFDYKQVVSEVKPNLLNPVTWTAKPAFAINKLEYYDKGSMSGRSVAVNPKPEDVKNAQTNANTVVTRLHVDVLKAQALEKLMQCTSADIAKTVLEDNATYRQYDFAVIAQKDAVNEVKVELDKKYKKAFTVTL